MILKPKKYINIPNKEKYEIKFSYDYQNQEEKRWKKK